jgi:multidrug efflux pump
MAEKQQELAKVILQDPAVLSLSSFIGADGINTTLNSGRMSINLKALGIRKISATDVIRRLQTRLKQVQGITLYMQPVQDITVDDRVSRTQYQFTLEDPDTNELNLWASRFLEKIKRLPQLTDVATDQQIGGLAASLIVDRVTASRLGIAPSTIDNNLYDAFGQRQVNTMYTQVNQYHVILEALPQFQRDPKMLQKIYIQANASSGTTGPGASSSFASSGSSAAGSNALTSTVQYTPSSGVLTPPLNALNAGVGATATAATNTSNAATSSTTCECCAAECVYAFRESHVTTLN